MNYISYSRAKELIQNKIGILYGSEYPLTK